MITTQPLSTRRNPSSGKHALEAGEFAFLVIAVAATSWGNADPLFAVLVSLGGLIMWLLLNQPRHQVRRLTSRKLIAPLLTAVFALLVLPAHHSKRVLAPTRWFDRGMPRTSAEYKGRTIVIDNGPLQSRAINRPNLGRSTGNRQVYIDGEDLTKVFVRSGRDDEALMVSAKKYIDQLETTGG